MGHSSTDATLFVLLAAVRPILVTTALRNVVFVLFDKRNLSIIIIVTSFFFGAIFGFITN